MFLLPKRIKADVECLCFVCLQPIKIGDIIYFYRKHKKNGFLADSCKHIKCVDSHTRIAQKASVKKRKLKAPQSVIYNQLLGPYKNI
jgi:hypothetical protein